MVLSLICRCHGCIWCEESIWECTQRAERKISGTHFAGFRSTVDLYHAWRLDGLRVCSTCFSHRVRAVLRNSNGYQWPLGLVWLSLLCNSSTYQELCLWSYNLYDVYLSSTSFV